MTDLALLKIAATGLPVLSLDDRSRVRQGELVFAIGSPGTSTGALGLRKFPNPRFDAEKWRKLNGSLGTWDANSESSMWTMHGLIMFRNLLAQIGHSPVAGLTVCSWNFFSPCQVFLRPFGWTHWHT